MTITPQVMGGITSAIAFHSELYPMVKSRADKVLSLCAEGWLKDYSA
jgi:hypothetical protein